MPFVRPPRHGSANNVCYSWRMEPARGESASGDGLFIESDRPDGCSLFLLVDATGHGSRAAAVVDVVERLLGDPLIAHQSPAALLRRLHGMLQPVWAQTGRWVAAQALLVPPRGAVTTSFAGLPPPRTGQPGGAWQVWDGQPGFPLGIPEEADYHQGLVPLPPATLLLAVTDGITEAGVPGPQFGEAGVQHFLASLPAGLGEDAVIDKLFATVQSYTGSGWPADDATAVCLRRPGGP